MMALYMDKIYNSDKRCRAEERGRRMKRVLSTVIVLSLLMVLIASCGDKREYISITTGGTGGTYYPIGGAIAQTLTENIDNLTVNSQVGNASIANCKLIGSGDTESALVQNNVAFWAYEGIGQFKDNRIEKLRGVASLYPEAIQIIAVAESGIKTVEDLKGKTVCVGEIWSGTYFDVINILAAHGMSEDDFNVSYLSFSEASQKLKDNEIDAAFITSGYPTSSVTDVNLVCEIVIVPIAEDKIAKMIEESPYYTKTVIPAGTYTGINVDVQTATTMAMWVISADVDNDLVYEMTKTLWENQTEVESAHEKGAEITLETALLGMGIPLHPGAQKYYNEKHIK